MKPSSGPARLRSVLSTPGPKGGAVNGRPTSEHLTWFANPRPVPPSAVKTCAVRPVFVRVVGELQAANPSKCPSAHEAKC